MTTEIESNEPAAAGTEEPGHEVTPELEAAPEPVVIAGPGQPLREAREAQGLSREEVAQRLHLKPALITALEADDFVNLPEPIYVCGYIRAYARLLGLPADELVTRYQSLGMDAPPPLVPATTVQKMDKPRPRLGRLLIAVAAVAVIVALVMWEDRHPPQQTEAQAPLPVPEQPAPSAPPGASPATQGIELPLPEAMPPTPSPAPSAGTPSPPPVVTAPVTHETPASPSSPAVVPSFSRSATVVVSAGAPSWVEITDATGKRVHDLLREGQQKTMQGTPPFEVMLGYAPGVTVQYNGAAFDHSRYIRGGNVARFKLE